MTREHESITKTSAIEQHLQTILTALLTAGIVTAVSFAWKTNEAMTEVVTMQEAQVAHVAQLSADVRSIRDRAASYEVRLVRIETIVDAPGYDHRQAEMRSTRAEPQEQHP